MSANARDFEVSTGAVSPSRPSHSPDIYALQEVNRRGTELIKRGRLEEAWACFRAGLETAPHCAEFHCNCGLVLQLRGDLRSAEFHLLRAVEIDPQHAAALTNLGNVYLQTARVEKAVQCYLRVLATQPSSAEAHCNLGNAYHELGLHEPSVEHYRHALRLQPTLAEAHYNLGVALEQQERFDEAERQYRDYLELRPDRPLRKLRILTMCPTVFSDTEAVDAYRERLLENIKSFSCQNAIIDLGDSTRVPVAPPFNLPFHGYDDLPIKRAFANLIQAILSNSPHGEGLKASNFRRQSGVQQGPHLLRIGFVVTKRHERAFVRCMAGVLEGMAASGFEVVIVCPLSGGSQIRHGIQDEAIRVVPVVDRPRHFAEALHAHHFDLLYYWEAGTDSTNYLLPFLRLAPVQCTSWGFPVTSGIPNMDVYLSSELLEPPGAQNHYTEQLVLLKTLPTCQLRRRLPPEPRTRDHFGFRNDQHMYLCVQKLGKFHPDFDPILAGILRNDDLAIVVALEDEQSRITASLRERLCKTMPDVSDRVIFLPRQSRADYLSLINVADVVLDTPHYCGATTTYDAFSLNKPIVTLPGKFHRSRYTAACCRKMAFTDCIASDSEQYVATAVKLATDPAYKTDVARQLAKRTDAIFNDPSAVTEHVRVFRELVCESTRVAS